MSALDSDLSHNKEESHVTDSLAVASSEAAPEAALLRRYGRLGPLLSRLFANGVEARGVERVPEDQRETKNMWNK